LFLVFTKTQIEILFAPKKIRTKYHKNCNDTPKYVTKIMTVSVVKS